MAADLDAMQPGSSLGRLGAALLAVPLVCGFAIPSSSSLRSDITLLYNNDLNRESSSHESLSEIDIGLASSQPAADSSQCSAAFRTSHPC